MVDKISADYTSFSEKMKYKPLNIQASDFSLSSSEYSGPYAANGINSTQSSGTPSTILPNRNLICTLLIVLLLVFSLLLERYSFILTVHQTQNFSFLTVMLVVILNCLINTALRYSQQQIKPSRLHELFQIERRQEIPNTIIGLIGSIDMMYTFLLFWPATVLPVLLLVTLLQFFIPMNMLFRTLAGQSHKKVHVFAVFIILAATIVGLIGVSKVNTDPNQFHYSLMFLGSGLMLALSHNLKESIIRRQPFDMTNFNFKVSIAQLLSLIIFTPLILLFCQKYERFTFPNMIDAQKSSFGEFTKVYLTRGFQCLTSTSHNSADAQCGFSWLAVLGYVSGVCALQLALAMLMKNRKSNYARACFCFMVPLTVFAFYLGQLTMPSHIDIDIIGHEVQSGVYYGVAVLLSFIGVFLYNCIEERKQKANVEEIPM